jgi:hypothetical protein
MTPVVVWDRERHTAICLGQGPTYVRLIEMRSGELTVSRLTEDDFAARGFAPLAYDVPNAVRRFLAHPGGVSTAARAALQSCLSLEAPPSDGE